MSFQVSTSPVTRIGRYTIASGDMYYSEIGQRDVYVCDDPGKGLRIWGEMPKGGPVTAIDLSQIFLEYGLFCQTSRDPDKAYDEMRSFGENLGMELAEYLKSTPILKDRTDPGACALECILEAIHARLSIEHIGPELRFIVADCSLVEVSESTGLREFELAQFGFNVMCQVLIHSIDPNLLLHLAQVSESSQAFTLLDSSHRQLELLPIAYPMPLKEARAKTEVTIDAFPPPEMAKRALEIGVKKASLDFLSTFVLAVLAGAFIAMGAIFATTVSAGGSALPYGVVRLLSGLAFSLGLIMVVVAGSELFTGNNLIVMAFLSGRIPLSKLARNWTIVYIGNFVGAALTAFLIFLTRQYTFGNGAVGLTALNIGESKTGLDFVQAIALGIGCNALVCMAVWMCYSARSNVDKILAIVPPIAAFVAAGFEHSIANMYFIPMALFIKYTGTAQFFGVIQKTPADFPHLTWSNFFMVNLLPVTIGNIIGGALMVGIVYWLIYLRKAPRQVPMIVSGVAHAK
jgi:formate transporter